MSKAWGTCAGCQQWSLHYIRTVGSFQAVVERPRFEYLTHDIANAAPDQVRWIPGVRVRGRRMLRECDSCGLQWWETLEQIREET